MPDTTPILQLPYILPSQAQKHVTHNEAIRVLDVLVQLAVTARNISVPPASPVQGDRYIVAAGASGAWAGKVGQIALYENGAWQFFAPMAGWSAWVTSEQVLASYNGSAWVSQADGPFNVGLLGISATPDASNRLSVSSPATLLNHAGAGHQLKVNKAAAGNTASLLFQTGFSGRAELGTVGSDDFAIKVSADGTAFATGLSIASATGVVTLPAAARLGGQASDPATPPNGTMWLNSTTGEVKMRSAGATVVIAPPSTSTAVGTAATLLAGSALAPVLAVRSSAALLGSAGWNFARGATQVGDVAYWPLPVANSGITVTKTASGIGADGLPFADYSVVGTASANTAISLYQTNMSRTPAAVGQAWTVSVVAQIIAGTAPVDTGTGVRLEVSGETTAGSLLQNLASPAQSPTSEANVSYTGTLSTAGIQQTRCGVFVRTTAGVTVNYTVRVKGLQFELGSTRTAGRISELTPAQAIEALGLGTASLLNAGGNGGAGVIGTTSGTVPALGAGGLLDAARIPLSLGARLIRTVAIPSAVAAVDFTNADMDITQYSDFVFVLRNVIPVTNNVRLWLRTSADGGATFAAAAGNYAHSNVGSNSTPNSGVGGATSAAQADLSFGATSNASGGGLSGEVVINGCDRALRQKWMFRTSHWRGDTSLFENTNGGGVRLSDLIINGARFMFSSGNIAGNANSSISIYGVAK